MDVSSISRDILSVLGKNRRVQLKAGALGYLFLSLVLGLGDGWVFSIGWLVTGVLGLAMLYKLTPRFFFLEIWLIMVYVFVFAGSLLSFKYAQESGSWFVSILGYMILIGAFILVLYLVLFIKERRDEYVKESGYVPIGQWTIFVMAFFWSALFSVIGWIRWSDGTAGTPLLNLFLYFMADLIMIFTMVYVVSFPEDRFKTAMDDLPPSRTLFKGMKTFIQTATGNRLKLDETVRKVELRISCPLCGIDLDKDIKKCPTCDTPRIFYWCENTIEYFVRCPNCDRLTPLGRDRCVHCSTRIVNKIRCSSCHSVHDLSRWME